MSFNTDLYKKERHEHYKDVIGETSLQYRERRTEEYCL